MGQNEPLSQFILFSQPRTGCHLLERMLSKQSRIHTYIQHPFGVSGRYPRDWLLKEPLTPIPEDLRGKHVAQIKKGLKLWQEKLKAAQKEEGKAIYVHFHPLFALRPEDVLEYLIDPTGASDGIRNPTSIPDDLLLQNGTVPVFTIRNPRLQVPSVWRVSTDTLLGDAARTESLAAVTGRWTRLLYDWYLAKGIQPIVVDADDYMSSEAFVRHLCEVSGLNPEDALIKWEKMDKEKMTGKIQQNHAAIQETLFASQGPESRRAAKNVDLEAEERGWDREFGRESAEMLRGIVKVVWPDYEYLRERRLLLPGSKL